MLLIGHPLIESEPFYRISTVEELYHSQANCVVFFNFDPDLAKVCAQEKALFALHVKQIKELILAHALGASYLIVDKALATQAQKIANDYLFDGKVLLLSNDENEIEFVALHGIDGILFESAIKTIV